MAGEARPSWFRFRPSPNDALVRRWVYAVTALLYVGIAAIDLWGSRASLARGAFHLLMAAVFVLLTLLRTGWGTSHEAAVRRAALCLSALALCVLAWRFASGTY